MQDARSNDYLSPRDLFFDFIDKFNETYEAELESSAEDRPAALRTGKDYLFLNRALESLHGIFKDLNIDNDTAMNLLKQSTIQYADDETKNEQKGSDYQQQMKSRSTACKLIFLHCSQPNPREKSQQFTSNQNVNRAKFVAAIHTLWAQLSPSFSEDEEKKLTDVLLDNGISICTGIDNQLRKHLNKQDFTEVDDSDDNLKNPLSSLIKNIRSAVPLIINSRTEEDLSMRIESIVRIYRHIIKNRLLKIYDFLKANEEAIEDRNHTILAQIAVQFEEAEKSKAFEISGEHTLTANMLSFIDCMHRSCWNHWTDEARSDTSRIAAMMIRSLLKRISQYHEQVQTNAVQRLGTARVGTVLEHRKQPRASLSSTAEMQLHKKFEETHKYSQRQEQAFMNTWITISRVIEDENKHAERRYKQLQIAIHIFLPIISFLIIRCIFKKRHERTMEARRYTLKTAQEHASEIMSSDRSRSDKLRQMKGYILPAHGSYRQHRYGGLFNDRRRETRSATRIDRLFEQEIQATAAA